MNRKDALRITLDNNDTSLIFDESCTREVLAAITNAAKGDDSLRDIILTSASILIAHDRDAISQYDIFKKVVEEMLRQKKTTKKTDVRLS